MLLRPAALILALAASALAWGEGRDGPERLAWLTYVEGEVEFQGAGERRTTSLPDRPLMPGDRLATRSDSRAELSLGTAAIRLDEDTEISIADLRAKSVRIALTGKSVSVHLHELLEGERFELVTPTATIALDWAGEYRVDVVTASAIALSVRSGVATVATSGGPIQVMDGQRVYIEGRGARAALVSARPRDDFDDWVLEREVQLAATEPPPDSDASEYERYGEWYEEPEYGRVWAADYAYDDWGSYGVWISSGHGWAWIGSAPCCGSIHGGRWVYVDHFGRWCWVPPTPGPLPQVASETHPFGRQTATHGRSTPVATSLGGGRQTARPRSSTSWGNGTSTMRPSGGSTMSSSASSSGSSRTTRPFGSTSSRRSNSGSNTNNPLGVFTPP